jgi:hypothetical protein
MPLAVLAGRQWVDRMDLVAGRDQRTDQQAPVGLDPHDDLRGVVGMLGQQPVQPATPSGTRARASTRPSGSSRHTLWCRSAQSIPTYSTGCAPPPSVTAVFQVRGARRHANGAVLKPGTTSHQPSVAPHPPAGVNRPGISGGSDS